MLLLTGLGKEEKHRQPYQSFGQKEKESSDAYTL